MSIPYRNNIDLAKNELQNAKMHLLGSAPASPVEGQVYYDTTVHKLFYRTNSAWYDITDALTLAGQNSAYHLSRTNHTGTQAESTITNLVSDLALKAPLASPGFTGVPSTPTAAPGDNTTQVSSTAFVTAAIALAVTGLLSLKGSTDCSANPNYPSGAVGDLYYVTVAGKIGGASGISVDIGDAIVCKTVNGGGNQATVGTSWFILEHNLIGALLSANNLSDLTNLTTARTNLVVPTGSGSSTGTNTGDQSDATLPFTNITTGNVTSTKHGFAPISPADITTFLNGAATPAYAAVKDSDLATTDVTTNNVSTTKHGFAPKSPNIATQYLDGTGAYSTPAGAVLKFSANIGDGTTTSIIVTHSLGTKDLHVAVYDNTTPFGVLFCDVQMTSVSAITLVFATAPTAGQYRVVCLG